MSKSNQKTVRVAHTVSVSVWKYLMISVPFANFFQKEVSHVLLYEYEYMLPHCILLVAEKRAVTYTAISKMTFLLQNG